MAVSKRLAYVDAQCVACGACVKVCPFNAIAVPKGITAVVDEARCKGCGKCEKGCPAGVITMCLSQGIGV